MSAYTSFISDAHQSYRVEKLVLHPLIFLLYLSRLVIFAVLDKIFWQSKGKSKLGALIARTNVVMLRHIATNYFLLVYHIVKNENAEDRKLQELEDNFLGKKK